MSPGQAPPDRPVLATYMHLTDPDKFKPALNKDPGVTVTESAEPSVRFYRFLYASVGSGLWWVDRLRWTDAALMRHLARRDITILVLYVRGTPAGYAELAAGSDEPGTELQYLGIFPEYHGRGLGRHLLSIAVERAFGDGATRIWLSTRSTDGPHAIPNYEARGFTIYRTEWEPAPVAPETTS